MYDNYRIHDIKRNITIMSVYPLDIMVTGVTGAGKSSTLNSFFKKEIAKVGKGVDPETMNLDSYSLNKYIRLWDTPGLGDGEANDRIHSKKLIDLLNRKYNDRYGLIDMILIIIEGSKRDMGTTYRLINEIALRHIQRDRILIAINQSDIAMKGYHWNSEKNRPDYELAQYLDAQVQSIKTRVREATGLSIITPIYYSALYNYNIDKLFDLIIDNMPKSRRNLL